MKTLSDIESEINHLIASSKDAGDKEKKVARKELARLYPLKIYLELNPTESTVLNQFEFLKKRIQLIKSQYSAWYKGSAIDGLGNPRYKNPKAKYKIESGLKSAQEQLSNIKYLLA